eukprot:219546-Pleurochrysis_carterae.AAC.2
MRMSLRQAHLEVARDWRRHRDYTSGRPDVLPGRLLHRHLLCVRLIVSGASSQSLTWGERCFAFRNALKTYKRNAVEC